MARTEQYSWASMISLAAVYYWYQAGMRDGWRLIDQPAPELLEIYFTAIAAATILELVIIGVFSAARRRGVAEDERDHAIAARAGQVERVFLIVAVNAVIWQALWEGAIDSHDLPRLDLFNLPTLFFVLLTILFAGEFLKRLATVVLYRANAGRS